MIMRNQDRKSRDQSRIVIFCVVLALASFGFIYCFPNVTESLDLKIYDLKLRLKSPVETSPDIAHVDIDDLAIRHFGMWPWDRSVSAWILKRLTDLGAKAVAFDILYTTSGKSAEGNELFFKAIKESKTFVAATAFRVSEKSDTPVLISPNDVRAQALFSRAWNCTFSNAINLFSVKTIENSLVPLEQILLNAAQVGHIKDIPDSDGIYRKVPLFVSMNDRVIPCLALATISVFWGASAQSVATSDHTGFQVTLGGKRLRIPVDERGMMLINWGSIWKSFPHYSVLDLLENEPDKLKAPSYRDKIVIVGVTATGATDLGISPRDPRTPLSRVHSHAINTILTGQFIRKIPLFPIPALMALLGAITLAVISSRLSLKWELLTALFTLLAGLGVVGAAFMYRSYEISLFGPLIIFLPATSVSIAMRTMLTEIDAYKVSKALERYLSADLVREIVNKREEVDLNTKKRDLTIMFVDIKGFSSMSEEVDVETINRYLNDFFELMTLSVFDHKGTVDKFLGDGLLAFFGDPVSLENHASAAVKAALQMQIRMAELNNKWRSSGIPQLENGMSIRIGLNSGQVIVGNIGSRRRLEYTVLGSAVNIASRLQSLSPPGGIIMSDSTWRGSGMDIKCAGPDTVKVKGIDHGISVYRILPETISGWAVSRGDHTTTI